MTITLEKFHFPCDKSLFNHLERPTEERDKQPLQYHLFRLPDHQPEVKVITSMEEKVVDCLRDMLFNSLMYLIV